jgi:hypothetical protein
VKEWFGTAARLVIGGVWIWAAALKLPNPDESVLAVRAYQLLPGDSATTVGHLLPVLEVVASVWARGITIDCGCFGGGGYDADAASQYPWEIARDVGLLALSVYLVWLRRTRLALDNVLFRPRADADLDPYLDPDLDLDLDDDLDLSDDHHSGV